MKLDENLPNEATARALARGADAVTVRQERLGGATDARLLEICQREHRVAPLAHRSVQHIAGPAGFVTGAQLALHRQPLAQPAQFG
ncbi:MAG: DUF5615 family PIN-like protein [Gemmatimonadales bacterium]